MAEHRCFKEKVAPDAINVKGKSLEGLGALAGGEGVAVQVVCLLHRRDA